MESMNIYNQLKTVPQSCLKQILGGRLKGMSDIKPQWRVETMTKVFGICGFGWKYKVTNVNFQNGAKGEISCFVDIDLFVKIDEVWSEAIPGNGGSMFVADESRGLYTSDEAVKMATTDALSVAMKMIGMGADVYMGHGGKYDKPIEEKQSNKPELEPGTEKWTAAVNFLKQNGTMQDITNKYYVNKENYEKLIKEAV